MDWLVDVDWKTLLVPETSVLELFIRGTAVYLVLFVLLRAVLKRESGAVGITDLLVLVLIADAAQNALADGYRSVPEGLLLVGVLVFWAYFLDWLGFRFPRVEKLIKPPRLPLVRDRRLVRENMAKELLIEEELQSQLRLQGVEDLDEVRAAYMEPDGRVSVLRDNDGGDGGDEGAGNNLERRPS